MLGGCSHSYVCWHLPLPVTFACFLWTFIFIRIIMGGIVTVPGPIPKSCFERVVSTELGVLSFIICNMFVRDFHSYYYWKNDSVRSREV